MAVPNQTKLYGRYVYDQHLEGATPAGEKMLQFSTDKHKHYEWGKMTQCVLWILYAHAFWNTPGKPLGDRSVDDFLAFMEDPAYSEDLFFQGGKIMLCKYWPALDCFRDGMRNADFSKIQAAR